MIGLGINIWMYLFGNRTPKPPTNDSWAWANGTDSIAWANGTDAIETEGS